MNIENKVGIAPEIRDHFGLVTGFGNFVVPFGTPVNAVQSATEIEADVIAALNLGATVTIETIAEGTSVYTLAAAPSPSEFTNAVELAALINGLDDWDSIENAGAVAIQATEGGALFNDHNFIVVNVEDTTANGNAGTQADATILATSIAAMNIGDTVEFDGNVFTLALAPGPAEFTNLAELAALINGLADWDGTIPVADILIKSSVNGAEWNGFEVVCTYNRLTDTGANGTPATIGAVVSDGARIYISTATAGFNNMSWQRSGDLNFLTY